MARPALALILTNLVNNWQAKYIKFLDINNSELNSKVYIRHKNITFDKKIKILRSKK